MTETQTRLLTAAVIGPISLGMLIVGGWVWALYAAAIGSICVLEFFSIMQAKGHQPMQGVAVAVIVGLLAVAEFAGIELAAGMLTAGILALLIHQLTAKGGGSAITNISVTLAGVMYVGWLLSHGVYLRHLQGPSGEDLGLFAVFYVLATTFLNDTGAYFAGRAFGRHKVAPSISPKKSWEGLIGGIVTAGLAAVVIKFVTELFFHPVPYGYIALGVLGMGCGLVGFFGDLVESLLKRDADVKDSGSLLPGHGGMLDRIDGLLFTLPFAYYCFIILNRISH